MAIETAREDTRERGSILQAASRTRANKFSSLVFPNPCHKARSEVFWALARLSSGHNVSVSALKAHGQESTSH